MVIFKLKADKKTWPEKQRNYRSYEINFLENNPLRIEFKTTSMR